MATRKGTPGKKAADTRAADDGGLTDEEKQKGYVKKIPLTEPVEAHGETLFFLLMRKPKGRHFKKISMDSTEAPFQMMLDFAAMLADVPPSTMDELAAEDVDAVVAFVGPFMPGYRQISKTS